MLKATPDRMKARQLARAKAFEIEMKKKTELLQPVCVDCCWWEPDQTSNPAIEMLKQFQVCSGLSCVHFTKPNSDNITQTIKSQ